MKKNYLLKVLLLYILCLILTTSLSGCKSRDKEIIIAKNVKEDLKSTNAEILQLIEEGNVLLESGEFPEARSTYEKAISKDKSNENTYLQIKNTYMNAKRFDDAYYIIKLAIDNNISKDSMLKILEEIKANFSTIQLEDNISQGSDYDLPNPKKISLDTIPDPVNIRWTQNNIDTSTSGTFTFEGYIDEYGRTVQLKLTIKEVVKQNKEAEKENNKITPLSNETEKKEKNASLTYRSSSLGIAFDLPASWANNYVIKDSGTEIRIYIKHESTNANDESGVLFILTSNLNSYEWGIDPMGQEKIRTINGKQFMAGATTGISLEPSDPKFNQLLAMHNDIPNILKTLRPV